MIGRGRDGNLALSPPAHWPSFDVKARQKAATDDEHEVSNGSFLR